MTKRASLVLVAMVGLGPGVWAPGASAQVAQEVRVQTWPESRDFRLDLGVVGGGQYFSADHRLGRTEVDPMELSPYHAGLFGLDIGFHLGRYVTLEAEGLASRTRTRDASTDLWVFQLGGHLRFHPNTRIFQPYLLLGYGAIASLVDDKEVGVDDQDGVGRAALGFRIGFSERIGIRLEGRVQSSLAFASKYLSIGGETAYGGPDFLGLGSIYLNLGEQPPRLVREKVFIKEQEPFPDPDRDGLITRADRCPTEPEDPDGYQDEDGCPDPDNDGDGIADGRDRCPLRPETLNKIDDQDGCPETDEDGDTLIGSQDQCPEVSENRNGYKDGDGCPDVLPVQLESVIGVIEGIQFRGATAQVTTTLAALDRVVAVLKEYPDLRIEVAGHAEGPGGEATSRELSQKRAERVREYLISKGLSGDRVVAVGYGMDHPVASNRTAAGRSRNRRVEIKLAVK